MTSESVQLDAVTSTPDKRTAKGTAAATNTTSNTGVTNQAKYKSTPIFRKLSGNPNTKKSLTHVHMDPALKEELFESELLNVSGLVEHLFPDNLIPVPFATLESAVRKKHWNTRLKDWKDYSPIDAAASAPGAGETALAQFFHGISETLVKTCQAAGRPFGTLANREWISECHKPLIGVPQARRKPDVCLVNKGQELTWMSALVTVELKSKTSEHKKAQLQLTNGAYMVFSTQDERRFHIGVSVCHTDVCVYVFDRAGIVGSKKFHLSSESKLLIRLLAGLILTDADAIGFDPSIRHHEDGTRSVCVNKLEYQIVKTLFISDSIRGRGTVCWQARRDSADFVIKNTWTDSSRIKTEADILRAAKEVEGIAHLLGEEIVQYKEHDDSTANLRSIIGSLTGYRLKEWYDKLEVRLHRRLVTTPLAEGITHFRSKKELLTVLIGAIEAHGRLIEKHILHRDISISNVMIYRPATDSDIFKPEVHLAADPAIDQSSPRPSTSDNGPNSNTQPAQGILVDLDYALVTHDDAGNKVDRTVDAAGHRTGTLPFMATEVLMGLPAGKEHQPYHDLESFFYVLLWITLQYAGPGNAERLDIDVEKEDQIKGWLQGKNIRAVGIAKATTMTTIAENFHEGVTSQCTLYFKDLIPCIEELRQKIFLGGSGKKATHQEIVEILRKPLEWLPDDDNWSFVKDPAGYGQSNKRKLDVHQEEDEGEEGADVESTPLASKSKCAKTAPLRDYRAPSRRSTRFRSMAPLQNPN